MDEIIKKYLIEATVVTSIESDDDFPPGNIVFGQKNKKRPYQNKLTGYNKVWDVDASEWTWDEFENSKGMEDPENYSDTLKSLGDIIPKFDFFHRLKRKVPDKDVESGYNRTPQTRDKEVRLGKDDVETAEVPDDIQENITERIDRILKKMTTCERCGKKSYVIFITKNHEKICDKCEEKERKKNNVHKIDRRKAEKVVDKMIRRIK